MLLSDLKQITKWDRIADTKDGFLVHFDAKEARYITGLSSNDETYYFNFDINCPVGFRVELQQSVTYYWTLNKRLHKETGPALVSASTFHDKSTHIVNKWYWNGLYHNDEGASVIDMLLSKIDEDEQKFIRISHLHHINGIEQGPKVKFQYGSRTKDRLTAAKVFIDYIHKHGNSPSNVGYEISSSGLGLHKVFLTDFDNGKFHLFNSSWNIFGEIKTHEKLSEELCRCVDEEGLDLFKQIPDKYAIHFAMLCEDVFSPK